MMTTQNSLWFHKEHMQKSLWEYAIDRMEVVNSINHINSLDKLVMSSQSINIYIFLSCLIISIWSCSRIWLACYQLKKNQ